MLGFVLKPFSELKLRRYVASIFLPVSQSSGFITLKIHLLAACHCEIQLWNILDVIFFNGQREDTES